MRLRRVDIWHESRVVITVAFTSDTDADVASIAAAAAAQTLDEKHCEVMNEHAAATATRWHGAKVTLAKDWMEMCQNVISYSGGK